MANIDKLITRGLLRSYHNKIAPFLETAGDNEINAIIDGINFVDVPSVTHPATILGMNVTEQNFMGVVFYYDFTIKSSEEVYSDIKSKPDPFKFSVYDKMGNELLSEEDVATFNEPYIFDYDTETGTFVLRISYSGGTSPFHDTLIGNVEDGYIEY